MARYIPESLRFLTNAHGSIQFMDPQYLELFNITGKKSFDIFSLGIILWEISSGNPPFGMESSLRIDLLNDIAKVKKVKRKMVIPGTPLKYKKIYTINNYEYLVAQSNVGFCYENGMGITKDETKAFQWNTKSALAGNIDAIYFYDNGIGVGKDEKEAFKLFLMAAEKRYSIAQTYLGYFYEKGYGINKDEVKAFEWYKKLQKMMILIANTGLENAFMKDVEPRKIL
ncbi:hypothetical protein Glove_140g72 [Diversispora epigaea]|uniref:Protein kinase domain-containing protein n=1 Tax=Diversispora epigaea TaxID=1348612 RepID=A0A397J3P5_9GLOM|nr:hypothetical protein Glove_140g72 [Diversispora epigaea]